MFLSVADVGRFSCLQTSTQVPASHNFFATLVAILAVIGGQIFKPACLLLILFSHWDGKHVQSFARVSSFHNNISDFGHRELKVFLSFVKDSASF